MRRFNFFVGSNLPWELIKTLKTKLWLRRLTQLTVSMVHLFSVSKIYKEAITEEFICSWQNFLWTTKTCRYSVLCCHSSKLKTGDTCFIFLDFVIRNVSVIFESPFDCISDNIFCYRFNAKYLQFDWLKQHAYFWYF